MGAECNSGYMGAGGSQGVQLLAVGTGAGGPAVYSGHMGRGG